MHCASGHLSRHLRSRRGLPIPSHGVAGGMHTGEAEFGSHNLRRVAMKGSGRIGRPRHNRLNTFEILFIILDAVDRSQIPAGRSSTTSFRKIWAELDGQIERERWARAWEFVRDEEMVATERSSAPAPTWRLTREGRILLRELRSGEFSSVAAPEGRKPRNAESGLPGRGMILPPSGPNL